MIDILYVNYNSSKLIIKSIQSVYRCNDRSSLNIYVWDNNSEDDVGNIVAAHPHINLFYSNKNVGFSKGINQLIKKAQSPYLVILNPDTEVGETFIETSIDYLRAHPDVGVLGPKILNTDGTVQGSARKFPDASTSLFGRNTSLSKLFPNNSITARNILTVKNGFHQPIEVDWVSGACMVVQRSTIRDVGGFDERFFLYWEDADFCRRAIHAGWKVVYLPKTTVVHHVGRSSNTIPAFANYQFHKSCFRLYDKYAKWPLSILTPVAAIALMLRFLCALGFHHGRCYYDRCIEVHKQRASNRSSPPQKIKVLRIISRMNIGGPSIHVKNLTEGLDPSKYETKLITGSVGPNEGDMSYIATFNEDVRIVIPQLQREIHPAKEIAALFTVVKIIHAFKPDIVDSHTSKAGAIARLAVFLYNLFLHQNIVTIHTFHGHVLEGYFNPLKTKIFQISERVLAKITDRVIAISESQKFELSSIYKVDNIDNIDTIKLGFNLDPFVNCSKHKGTLRKKLHLSADTLLIGIVGRLAPIKNHKMFLDAGKLLATRCADKKIKLVLIGDGEERIFLENYARTIGLEKSVIFYGWERDIPMVYADIDILALTSLNEGTPVSVIEALAASVPVVTTGVGGIKDLLGQFEDRQPADSRFKICERGILCPKDDATVFSRALQYMIESNYLNDRQRFSTATDFVIENYSIDRLVHDIDKLYENLYMARLH